VGAPSRSRDFWDYLHPHGLISVLASEGERCRCGTRLLAGAPSFGFGELPPPLKDLLDHQRFCGVPCAHAFLLETLELTGSSSASSTLSDIREIRQGLRLLLALIDLQTIARSTLTPSKNH